MHTLPYKDNALEGDLMTYLKSAEPVQWRWWHWTFATRRTAMFSTDCSFWYGFPLLKPVQHCSSQVENTRTLEQVPLKCSDISSKRRQKNRQFYALHNSTAVRAYYYLVSVISTQVSGKQLINQTTNLLSAVSVSAVPTDVFHRHLSAHFLHLQNNQWLSYVLRKVWLQWRKKYVAEWGKVFSKKGWK